MESIKKYVAEFIGTFVLVDKSCILNCSQNGAYTEQTHEPGASLEYAEQHYSGIHHSGNSPNQEIHVI